ncbi:TauD/TfdA family dioxygenase [Roseococcus sp. SDR]|uniref:TauD/TfdA dioxygenase family protein n=1 Tax=Roseococcus sp. SDR TaxID=2835532 RepID=UPI001BCDDE33|nr:TauD/TfdA family dioxygenase [Roseococcus sp. SDR]MBS7790632.1 TauD/TfdA family dioxygenase [Roseococcus sp. SDR]MBV1845946.1 TauD/TfdA family dioxygenase [Roseococcus sp. SDR]
MRIVPNNTGLGARIHDLDLSRPLAPEEFRTVLRALGEYGVLCFPGQDLDAPQLAGYARRFGELEVNVANMFHAPGLPEIMILSNKRDAAGKPVGLNDAGQGWHTDMSYSTEIALANVLHAKEVPLRDGRPLGDTQFRNMHAAYEDLSAEVKQRLEGRVAIHDFQKFWDMMRIRPGSIRGPLTPEQRAKKPPVRQPIFRTHPITGRRVLYCNPGYAMEIEGLEKAESDALLDYLFRHQSQAKYLHSHAWTPGDVLMWDNIGTTHNARADYGPDEPRFILRAQVMASLDYAALAA